MSAPGFFITVKDLMLLHNSYSYEAMRRLHQTIRDCLTSERNKTLGRCKSFLTVKEYCDYQDLNEQEVIAFLQKQRTKEDS